MGFDVEGARKAGYSEPEIVDHLAKQSNFDVAGAKKAAELTKMGIIAATPHVKAGAKKAAELGLAGAKKGAELGLAGAKKLGSWIAGLAKKGEKQPALVAAARNPMSLKAAVRTLRKKRKPGKLGKKVQANLIKAAMVVAKKARSCKLKRRSSKHKRNKR